MTELKTVEYRIESADFGLESCLPPISTKLSLGDISNKFNIDEDDGLYVNYGVVESSYPYKYIDMYGRKLTERFYKAVVLENEYIKAVFMPNFGGKLWSLYDKENNRELLFKNDVVRPCNLGVRNAWLSGGIEWNAGFKGHNPFTCSLINTARTHLKDGTPVLRFYYFERIRCAVVQIDFFLPEKSKKLFTRVRITNPNDEVIPMYWWSNVAVDYGDGDRVVVPAEESYTAPNGEVVKIKVPVHNGIDVTYPEKNITSNDYFWKMSDKKRRYIAKLDKDGYGLSETSTNLLKGRKLFVWGNSQGGSKWMNFLTADDKTGVYSEIQCGLARTQYECLPMPPHTVWEWLETYGPMQADKTKIHGEWIDAQKEVERIFDSETSEEELEAILKETQSMAKRTADEIILDMADGWGALEELRREKKVDSVGLMNKHLDFGKCTAEQKDWITLLESGTVGTHKATEVPVSYIRQKEWLELLQEAIKGKDKNNWYAYYLLGTANIANENYAEAEEFLQKSVKLCDNAWTNYALAINAKKVGNAEREVQYMLKAYELRKNDLSLTKELLRSLFENKESEKTIEIFDGESEEIKKNERCLLYYAYALARIGKLDEAEKILCGKDGKEYLVVPDIRECELTITQLWVFIREQKGLTREEMGEPPYDLDFRMFAAREGWF